MKILVTGANGFIGKSLVACLDEKKIPCIPFIEHHQSWDASIFNKYLDEGVTHVVHLAARSFVPDSWNNPEQYIQTNVSSTVSVLEFCRKTKAKLIYFSSYMYGIPEYLPIDELHPVAVLNPYALSKYLSEETCIFFAKNFNIQTCVLRVFNVYGPGQKSSFLIPHIIDQVLNMKEVSVKDLKPKRDYIYIDDLINAVIHLFELDLGCEIFNIGSGYSYSVEEIIEIAQKMAGTSKPVISLMETRSNEIMDVRADISKIQKISGWNIKTSFTQGLEKCINS
ncbi:MAG: NAD-dependent epimerase/dehydratase family protein [Sediminibacterium sp.]|nr:NAD-dependent epimerase/dehydratase family protein [Sediminibacterium sp.]